MKVSLNLNNYGIYAQSNRAKSQKTNNNINSTTGNTQPNTTAPSFKGVYKNKTFSDKIKNADTETKEAMQEAIDDFNNKYPDYDCYLSSYTYGRTPLYAPTNPRPGVSIVVVKQNETGINGKPFEYKHFYNREAYETVNFFTKNVPFDKAAYVTRVPDKKLSVDYVKDVSKLMQAVGDVVDTNVNYRLKQAKEENQTMPQLKKTLNNIKEESTNYLRTLREYIFGYYQDGGPGIPVVCGQPFEEYMNESYDEQEAMGDEDVERLTPDQYLKKRAKGWYGEDAPLKKASNDKKLEAEEIEAKKKAEYDAMTPEERENYDLWNDYDPSKDNPFDSDGNDDW